MTSVYYEQLGLNFGKKKLRVKLKLKDSSSYLITK